MQTARNVPSADRLISAASPCKSRSRAQLLKRLHAAASTAREGHCERVRRPDLLLRATPGAGSLEIFARCVLSMGSPCKEHLLMKLNHSDCKGWK
ncbi:hypothetical protein BS78_01G399500 [Paspalum vaginatum]|nr:hypothetical protein BS78_01G399500 [Paspalum vaginatum]